MTLAVILLLGIFSLTSVDPGTVAHSAPQSDTSVGAPVTPQQSPPTQTTPDANKPASGMPSAQSSTGKPKSRTTKKTPYQKKQAPSDPACDPAPANASSPASAPTPGSPKPGNAVGQTTSNSEAQQNCPPSPPKVVVRQGGIAEQSIQLAGGSSGGDATQKRQSTNQMLTATEENLKKATSIQLSADQQSSVTQIRQFVTQSKSALAAADYERAHTLAWKAKVLSDDLVNPKK